MSSGNWKNNDNLYLEFGTTKAVTENSGEYRMTGQNRVVELVIDLVGLNATPFIISQTEIFPSGPNIIIEAVELVVEVAATGASTLSVGLIQDDRATIPATYSTAFINAEVTGTLVAGGRVYYTAGVAKAGGLIGSTAAAVTGPGYYITATGTATAYTTGRVRVRIFYHGIGTITQ